MKFKEIVKLLEIRCAGGSAPIEERDAILVQADKWLEIAQILKDDPDLTFDSLMCLSGYDKGDGENLGVAYNFHSMSKMHKLEVRIEVPTENPVIPSISEIWETANWHEREAWDMYGIKFEGHPNLKRMLLPEDWVGHPLRKDYETPESYHDLTIPKDKTYWE